MKLLPTTDDSIEEDGSIPSFWYEGYSYYLLKVLSTNEYSKQSYIAWLNDNSSLNRKFTKPSTIA